jgi:hypothetical protein
VESYLQFDAASLLNVNPWTDDTTIAVAATTKSKSEMSYVDRRAEQWSPSLRSYPRGHHQETVVAPASQ